MQGESIKGGYLAAKRLASLAVLDHDSGQELLIKEALHI